MWKTSAAETSYRAAVHAHHVSVTARQQLNLMHVIPTGVSRLPLTLDSLAAPLTLLYLTPAKHWRQRAGKKTTRWAQRPDKKEELDCKLEQNYPLSNPPFCRKRMQLGDLSQLSVIVSPFLLLSEITSVVNTSSSWPIQISQNWIPSSTDKHPTCILTLRREALFEVASCNMKNVFKDFLGFLLAVHVSCV